MDFLTQWLAKLFSTFKTNNPKLAAIILLVLGTFIYAADNGLGDVVGKDLSQVVKWVSIALAALTGSHTTEILSKDKK